MVCRGTATNKKKLPFVCVLLLCSGRNGYNRSTALPDLMHEPKEQVNLLFDQPIPLVDLKNIPDERRRSGGTSFGKIVLGVPFGFPSGSWQVLGTDSPGRLASYRRCSPLGTAVAAAGNGQVTILANSTGATAKPEASEIAPNRGVGAGLDSIQFRVLRFGRGIFSISSRARL